MVRWPLDESEKVSKSNQGERKVSGKTDCAAGLERASAGEYAGRAARSKAVEMTKNALPLLAPTASPLFLFRRGAARDRHRKSQKEWEQRYDVERTPADVFSARSIQKHSNHAPAYRLGSHRLWSSSVSLPYSCSAIADSLRPSVSLVDRCGRLVLQGKIGGQHRRQHQVILSHLRDPLRLLRRARGLRIRRRLDSTTHPLQDLCPHLPCRLCRRHHRRNHPSRRSFQPEIHPHRRLRSRRSGSTTVPRPGAGVLHVQVEQRHLLSHRIPRSYRSIICSFPSSLRW